MLEKAPAPEAGGNSRYTSTGWRFVHAGLQEIRTFMPQVSDADAACMHIDPYTEQRFGDDLMRVTRGRIQATLDIFNLLNSSGILSQNNTFGTAWQAPTNILQGRLMKLGALFEF